MRRPFSWQDSDLYGGTPPSEEEDEYSGGSPPTIPRILSARDSQAAWNLQADCHQGSEGDSTEVESADHQARIAATCDELKAFLLEKNAAYGDSAFRPARVFSKLDAREGILVRIDDKIKRIQNATTYPGDNDVKDLAGYLVLLMSLEVA